MISSREPDIAGMFFNRSISFTSVKFSLILATSNILIAFELHFHVSELFLLFASGIYFFLKFVY